MLSRKGTGLREGVWVLPHCTAALASQSHILSLRLVCEIWA